MTTKRERPTEVKQQTQIASFEQQLEEWDRKQNAVDYKELCEKLQEALAKSYCEYEGLEKINKELINERNIKSCIIDYLEGRLK